MKLSTPAALLLSSMMFLGLASAQDGPETVLRGTKEFRKSVLISGLAGPWEVTWGPDSWLWVTERTGKRITRVNPTNGEKKVAITIDEVSAPGGQDGLLGMALDPGLLKGSGHDFVYVFYSYVDQGRGAHPWIADARSRYRYLYGKIVRLTYDKASQTLSNPVEVIAGLPSGNDHDGGRLKYGPDNKLYLTIGDQGHNQLGNFCLAVESQRFPTAVELAAKDFTSYVGKSLRINLDGSVPKDNPKLGGVVSHVFTYGHRNPQGIDFGPDGTLYESEQGPKTDDEVNILTSGSNYGWPHIAGLKDNKAFEYAHWSEAKTPCNELKFSDLAIHPSVPREPESAYDKPFVSPVATMFTVPTGYNFEDPACKGINFICWPTVGASSIEYYSAKSVAGGKGVPGWDKVLFVTTLKRGSLYVLPLTADGKKAAGHFSRYFQSENRYRDTAVSPDGRTIYIATDPGGLAESSTGGTTTNMHDKGAILAFTYIGEGTPRSRQETSKVSAPAEAPAEAVAPVANGVPPQFTSEQASTGKTAFNANCAVCHGNTMTNGTMGTPLAGEYFKTKWSGKTVKAFYEKSKTMPPGSPNSLPNETYANIVAYILEFNGHKAGDAKLPTEGDSLGTMVVK